MKTILGILMLQISSCVFANGIINYSDLNIPQNATKGWIDGYEAAEKFKNEQKKEQIELLQKRANRVHRLTVECMELQKNWNIATKREKIRCLAIKNFNENNTPISDEILFGP